MLGSLSSFRNLHVYHPSDSFMRAPEHCTWHPAASYMITCLFTTYVSVFASAVAECCQSLIMNTQSTLLLQMRLMYV